MIGRLRALRWVAAAGAGVLLAGCGAGADEISGDPLIDLADGSLSPQTRARSVEDAWYLAETGARDRGAIRERFSDLVWEFDEPGPVRLAALEALLESDEGETADMRDSVRLLIPLEPNDDLAEYLAYTSAARGWVEASSALIRRLAERASDTPIDERPSYIALREMSPDATLAELIEGTLFDPDVVEGDREDDRRTRAREAAITLLGRLDPSGAALHEMLAAADPSALSLDGRALVDDLRLIAERYRVVPRTGVEMTRLRRLVTATDPVGATWDSAAASAAAALTNAQAKGLRSRHLTALIWAREHRPLWVDADRSELLNLLAARLDGRRFRKRTDNLGPDRKAGPDRLSDWADALSWGDVLTMLAIDETLSDLRTRRDIFEQLRLDRRDESTEYGGLLWAEGVGGADRAGGQLYVPRARDRTSDLLFVASADLERGADHALAIYHFHAASRSNGGAAGPSGRDFAYTDRTRLAAVVLTSVGRDRLNVDYYHAGELTIDLGMLTPATDDEARAAR